MFGVFLLPQRHGGGVVDLPEAANQISGAVEAYLHGNVGDLHIALQNQMPGVLQPHGAEIAAESQSFRQVGTTSNELSRLLNLRIDAAAIELSRTTFSGSVVVEYCDSVIRGDLFSCTVELK